MKIVSSNIKHKCDVCGEEVIGARPSNWKHFSFRKAVQFGGSLPVAKDFCDACMVSQDQNIKNQILDALVK